MAGLRFRIPGKQVPSATGAVTVVKPPGAGAVSVAAPVAKAQTLAAAANAKIDQIRAQAQADLELIRDRSRAIAKAFHEVGQALARLKQPVAYGALGYKSFAELCQKEFSFSVEKADELVLIATQMSAQEALGIGQKKAIAVVRLCRATIEDDKPADVARGTVTLPSGEIFDVKRASARKTEAAAAQIRAASGRALKRGKGVAQSEHAAGVTLEAKLRAAGLANARVRVVAGAPGKAAWLRLDRIPVNGVKTLCKAICGKGR
jgi:hypothetical protein